MSKPKTVTIFQNLNCLVPIRISIFSVSLPIFVGKVMPSPLRLNVVKNVGCKEQCIAILIEEVCCIEEAGVV